MGAAATSQDSLEIARLLKKMAAAADRVFVVADSSKLGQTALSRSGRLQDWAGLVTHAAADRSILTALRKTGVRVVVGHRGLIGSTVIPLNRIDHFR